MVSFAVKAGQPPIVVGLVVDGLRSEYLDLLRDQFGTDGFNRLIRNGVVLENIDYGTNLDAAASAAVLMTGASPSANGIGAGMRYNPTAKRFESSVYDGEALGNYTDQTFSGRSLRVSTITDENRIAGAGVGYAYSIAADPALAIILAGHAANSAVWLNDKTGYWCSSAYYPEIPAPITRRNRVHSLKTRLDTMQWTPSAASARADFLPGHLTRYPFRYTFAGSPGVSRVQQFAASPLVNKEVTDIAKDYISTMRLGTHDAPDMLNVAYSLQQYPWSKTPENRYELIDSYIKLDAYIADLLRTLDAHVGRDKALVYLAATPPPSSRRRDDEKWQIPTGEFSTRKAVSLLNLYLIALHGNGEWVRAFADGVFYLNDITVKEHNLNIRDIRQEAADFLKRMSGVDRAYTSDALINGTTGKENAEAMRRNTVVTDTGDVYVELAPGWELVDDYNNVSSREGKVSVNALTTAPAFIMSPGIAPRTVTRTIDARAIAPTIAGQMHIRPPNGSALPALRLTNGLD